MPKNDFVFTPNQGPARILRFTDEPFEHGEVSHLDMAMNVLTIHRPTFDEMTYIGQRIVEKTRHERLWPGNGEVPVVLMNESPAFLIDGE